MISTSRKKPNKHQISQLFPSGRQLLGLSGELLNFIRRLTQTLVVLQRETADTRRFRLYIAVRDSRWTAATIWKEFEVLMRLSSAVAESALSVPAMVSGANMQREEDVVRSAVLRLQSQAYRQKQRIGTFKNMWRGVLTAIHYQLPGLVPPSEVPDLAPYISSVEHDMSLLQACFDEIERFWAQWARNVPEGLNVSISDIVFADRPWLEREWDVAEGLRACQEGIHELFLELYNEPPALVYPIP